MELKFEKKEKRFKRLLFSCNTSLYVCMLSMKERERESKIKEEHTKKQVQEKERKTARGKKNAKT